MSDKVAVVTGSNKGIGYGIVKELCRRGVGAVYLTARDATTGHKAIENLNKEGYYPLFYQLDVTERNCLKKFAEHLKEKHGGLDILINNAGVITADFTKTTYEDSKYVIDVNYRSIVLIQEHIFPTLKYNARVINMSSDCGHISFLKNKHWIRRIISDDITINDTNSFVDWFLESVKNNTVNEDDFEEKELLAYRVSKIAVSALTRLQQKKIDRDISINSLNPGFVRTDMTKNAGHLNTDESSVTPVFLALDVDQSVKGKYFWFDKTEKDWHPDLKIHSLYEVFERGLKAAGSCS